MAPAAKTMTRVSKRSNKGINKKFNEEEMILSETKRSAPKKRGPKPAKEEEDEEDQEVSFKTLKTEKGTKGKKVATPIPEASSLTSSRSSTRNPSSRPTRNSSRKNSTKKDEKECDRSNSSSSPKVTHTPSISPEKEEETDAKKPTRNSNRKPKAKASDPDTQEEKKKPSRSSSRATAKETKEPQKETVKPSRGSSRRRVDQNQIPDSEGPESKSTPSPEEAKPTRGSGRRQPSKATPPKEASPEESSKKPEPKVKPSRSSARRQGKQTDEAPTTQKDKAAPKRGRKVAAPSRNKPQPSKPSPKKPEPTPPSESRKTPSPNDSDLPPAVISSPKIVKSSARQEPEGPSSPTTDGPADKEDPVDDTFSRVARTGILNPLMKKPVYMSGKPPTVSHEPVILPPAKKTASLVRDNEVDIYDVDVYGEEEFGPEPQAKKKKKVVRKKRAKKDITLTFGKGQSENMVSMAQSRKTPAQPRPKRNPLKLVNYAEFLPDKPAVKKPAAPLQPKVIIPEKPPISGELINGGDTTTGFTRDCDDFFPTYDEMATSYPEPSAADDRGEKSTAKDALDVIPAKNYLTPEVPKKVSKNQGGNVSTPRPPTPPVVELPSPKKTTKELVQVCFGFETEESEVEENESLLGGISPVKGTGLLAAGQAHPNAYGSILSPSNSVMCSSRISTAAPSAQKLKAPPVPAKFPMEEPSRFMLPLTKKATTLKEFMARKKYMANVKKKREEVNKMRNEMKAAKAPAAVDMTKEISQSEELGFMSEIDSSKDATNKPEEREMTCNPGEPTEEDPEPEHQHSKSNLVKVTKIPPPALKTKQTTIQEAMGKGGGAKKRKLEELQ